MRLKESKVVGKMKLDGVGWEISEGKNIYGERQLSSEPICMKCQTQLKLEGDHILICQARTCSKYDQRVTLAQSFMAESSLARMMWEARERRNDKLQWVDFNRELLPLGKDKDSNSSHWVKAFLYDSKEGPYLMVLAGNKDQPDDKVQFFVKDEIDVVAFDQVGDLNPKEVFMSFTAKFSDGTATKTDLNNPKDP